MRRKGRYSYRRDNRALRRGAIAALFVMGGIALAGPSGLLAWSDNLRLLDQRRAQLDQIEAEREALSNKVALLNPDNADPDMVGELLRSQLNVVHPDEVVVKLDEAPAED